MACLAGSINIHAAVGTDCRVDGGVDRAGQPGVSQSRFAGAAGGGGGGGSECLIAPDRKPYVLETSAGVRLASL